MKTSSVFILVLNGLITGVCFAEIEFVGYMKSTEAPRFALKESTADKPSGWLQLGESYLGYKLLTHDPQRDVLLVEKRGTKHELTLKLPRVADDKSKSPRYKIGRVTIRFDGKAAVPEQVVRDSMQIRPGDEFDETVLDRSIRSLYRTGHFKLVQIKNEGTSPGIYDLVVIVTPKSP